MSSLKRLWYAPYSRPFLQLLLAVNIVGAAFGYNWYVWQLRQLPVFTWIVVFDSPLSVTGVALVAWFRLRGRTIAWLELFSALAVIKYGAWAALLWAASWSTGTPITPFDFLGLFLTHLGMVVLGFIVLRRTPAVPRIQALAVVLWFFLNDYFDYVHNLHPTFPSRLFAWCAATAVALSCSGALLAFWHRRRHRAPAAS